VVGSLADVESTVCLKDFMTSLGTSYLTHSLLHGTGLTADIRSDYVFNTTIRGIEEADLLLLVGTNPRMEAPIVNTRIRKAVLQSGLKVASIGPEADLAYDAKVQQLGNDLNILSQILQHKHPFAEKLKKASRPVLVVGLSALQQDGKKVLSLLRRFAKEFPKLDRHINFLHTAASAVGALDVGFVPGPSVDVTEPIKAKFVYLLGVDDEKFLAKIPSDAFVVYQGHHGDLGAARANVILPSPAYTEKSGIYVNLEGRVQRTEPATQPVGEAREDWQIIRALSEVVGKKLPYNRLEEVRQRVGEIAPHLVRIDRIEPASTFPLSVSSEEGSVSGSLTPLMDNFFMTDPISRSSRVMAKCSTQLPVSRNSYVNL